MTRKLLFFIIGALAVTAVIFEIQNSPWKQVMVPLTTFFILVLTYMYGKQEQKRYFKFIILAMTLAVIGDALPLFGDVFIWEILTFIIVKYLFCEAFLSYKSKGGNKKLFGVLLIIAVVSFALLFDFMGEYLVPTAIYLGVTIYYIWAGIKLHNSGMLASSKYVLAAVFIWFLCDLLSGVDRYVSATYQIGSIILLSYFGALFLIGLSVLKPAEEPEAVSGLELETA